ncbi:MAG: tetratricopeptide repeat protein [Campylobacteraceae bacterium]
MDTFFLDYRDPIFGIIIFFAVIFVIAFANYWWGVFKSNEEKNSIEQFIKRFEVMADANEYKKLLDEFSISSESLGLLAHSFAKSGEYEKAIGIYLIALKRVKNKDEKQYILTELGKTYFKAGFLRRSTEVFIEALRLYPRNEEALRYLTVTYEQLQEYDRALEVLDALEELNVDVALEKNFMNALKVLSEPSKTDKVKYNELIEVAKKEPLVARMLFEFARKTGLEFDINLLHPNTVFDLLWESNEDVLKTSDATLVKSILCAKGLSNEKPEKMPFELEILSVLSKEHYTKAGLNFEYTCSSCKGTFPMHFYRCPSCHSLKLPFISANLIKNEYEAYYSF